MRVTSTPITAFSTVVMPGLKGLGSGAPCPIVELTQANRTVSVPSGSDTANGFPSELKRAVLLYPSSVKTMELARKYCRACSALVSFEVEFVYSSKAVDGALALRFAPVQLLLTVFLTHVAVLLSARTRNVLPVALDRNATCTRGPPGRVELFGVPY